MLLMGSLAGQAAFALSPPNITTDIKWGDNFSGVADIMAAFNNARRAEEQQLNLPANSLGNLVLPSQTVWSGMSDDAKALFLINAERTARNQMQPGVLGLPYAGVERHVDEVSRDYAQLLHDLSKIGHYQPSNDPNVDNPSKRLDNGVGASCREFISRSENLAYFAAYSSQAIGANSIPLPLERAIYGWIYDDSNSQWGHREAVLLQDMTLSNNPWGYNNDNGVATHEGFLGFHVIGSTSYKPFGEPPANMPYNYGVAVVMNIFDPLSDAGVLSQNCGYDVTLRTEDLPTTTPVNQAPKAVTDNVSTAYDTAVTINALSNDTDPDNDSLTITAHTQPSHGSVTRAGNTFTYTPQAGFNGTDSFNYTITDNKGNSATGLVNVTVQPTTNRAPNAVTDNASTTAGQSVKINVLSNDTDPDHDLLSITSVTNPTHGTVTKDAQNVLTYIPAAGFSGTDSFTYTISDGQGHTSVATVNLTVNAPANRAPTAVSDTATTAYGTQISIQVLSNDTDPDHDTLTLIDSTNGTNGTVAFSDTAITYTPRAGFSGEDSFTYTISDGNGHTAIGQVKVTVGAAPNRAPSAVTDNVSTAYGTALTITPLTNDTDPENDMLSVTSNTQAINGTVTRAGNSLTYTPRSGFSGVDSFTYTVSDGKGNSATGTVNVTVRAAPVANKAPLAVNDTIKTTMGVPVLVNLLANDTDPDGDKIALKTLSNPKNGKLYRMNDSYIFYFPNAGFVGTDSFTYSITDSKGAPATAVVSITVTPANKLPIAKNDVVTAKSGKAVSLNVLANDSDPDGDALTVLGATVPSHGSIRWQDKQTIIYTPRADYTGWDNFAYTITDSRGGAALALVSVWVSK
jgi:hypothetical protein